MKILSCTYIQEDLTMLDRKQNSYTTYTILLATLFIGLFFHVLNIIMPQSFIVSAAESTELSTIHHVYLDDTYLGPIKDKTVVEKYLAEQIESMEQADEGFTYGTAQELSYIPERVFYVDINIEQLLTRLDQQLEIDILATTITFENNQLGHFASVEQAEEAIFQYKSLFVDEERLLELAEQEDSERETSLEIGESRVVDVSLSEDVLFTESIVSKDELINVKEAVQLLEKGTLEDMIHVVESGDTLYSIAALYDLTEETLLELNEDLTSDSILRIDQEINVTDYVPIVDVIVYEEELKEETIAYKEKTEQTDDLFRGETKLKQSGSDGKKHVHRAIEKINGQVENREVLEEEVIKEVQDEITLEGTKVISSRGTGDFIRPAIGGYISSQYGPRWGSFHRGVDFARPSNRNILASDNGVVEVASSSGSYGNYVVINHNNGFKTLYAHLSSISVRVGQTVPQGTKIGVMGSTGRSTGIHLHFEVLKNGSNINPMSVLN